MNPNEHIWNINGGVNEGVLEFMGLMWGCILHKGLEPTTDLILDSHLPLECQRYLKYKLFSEECAYHFKLCSILLSEFFLSFRLID